MAKKQGPKDINEVAFRVFQQAVGEVPVDEPKTKSEAAVKRGAARAEKMSAERRSEIARAAAQKRWAH